jgi:hypothetical protein
VDPRLERVDVDARTVFTAGGRELSYDAVLVAVGARESPSYEHVETFSDGHAEIWFREPMAAIERGDIGSVAFVIPDGPRWPVPPYELALTTARRARAAGHQTQITIVTPEPGRPLKAFGTEAGDAVRRLLADAGITLLGGCGRGARAARGDGRHDAAGGRADRDGPEDHRPGDPGTARRTRRLHCG